MLSRNVGTEFKNSKKKAFLLGRARRRPFFLDFLTLEDGTDRLTRNVDTELPLYAA
jgi:hypothetical protein